MCVCVCADLSFRLPHTHSKCFLLDYTAPYKNRLHRTVACLTLRFALLTFPLIRHTNTKGDEFVGRAGDGPQQLINVTPFLVYRHIQSSGRLVRRDITKRQPRVSLPRADADKELTRALEAQPSAEFNLFCVNEVVIVHGRNPIQPYLARTQTHGAPI